LSFAATWSALQANLTPGTTVSNWTAANGFLGDTFTVTTVGSTHVEVDTPGAQNIQKVPSADFETAYNLWQRYCKRQVTRPEIRDATHFSKYVISLLHWLEGQCGGQLP
jgi:hypothetical protein